MKKVNPLVQEYQLRLLRQKQQQISTGGNTKKKAKPLGYKMQNTFERNLKGVPGGSMSRGVTASLLKQIEAPGTGCKVIEAAERPGLFKSRRNSNTTSGSYVTSILQDQTGDTVSNRQGRDTR